jgi:signal recognition particle subunit SRP72
VLRKRFYPRRISRSETGYNVSSHPCARKLKEVISQTRSRHATNVCASPSLPIYFDNFPSFLSQVLRLVPDDNDARQTKLFLLLQTERYSDALGLLGAANQSSVFERAYSSYRLQHLDEAVSLLDGIKERQDQSRGALHLEAQLVRSTSALEAQSEFFLYRTTDKAITRLPSTCITSSSTPLTR